MIVLKNILVATDFSEPSANALAYGKDLARSYSATLHVLHVTEDVLMRYSPEVGFAVPDLQKDLEDAARRELDAIITNDDMRTLRTVPAIETATAQEATTADIAAAPAAPPATQTMAATLVAPEPPQPVAPDLVPASGLPSLDLVRAEPGAPPVIAGRAAPGSRLIVLDNGAPLGEATADANGEWAMVGDAPLAAGRHELTLALETPWRYPRTTAAGR